MNLLDSFKLQKLTISGFDNRERTGSSAVFEAMFNPESIKQQYGVRYAAQRGAGANGTQSVYLRSEPSDLRLELLLDGSGVTDDTLLPPGPAVKTVSERVDQFLAVAYRKQGETHQPKFLVVQWGDIWPNGGFRCRLISVDITYTRFSRDGKPLRAKLDVMLRDDSSWEEQVRRDNPSSPDLTHRHTVIAGDTLPLLSERVYGSPQYVTLIARFNRLGDLRFLKPGTELVFPPLPGHSAPRKRPS